MLENDPSNDFRRRKRLPYDWEIRKAKRRRIAGRIVIGCAILAAIVLIIIASSFHSAR